MRGRGEQCCLLLGSSSLGIPPSKLHATRKRNNGSSINKKRQLRRSHFGTVLMAGAVLAVLVIKVENGALAVFVHGHQTPTTGRSSLLPLAGEEEAPSREDGTAAARRTLRTEAEAPPGVMFVGRTRDRGTGKEGDRRAGQLDGAGGVHVHEGGENGGEKGDGMGEVQIVSAGEEEQEQEGGSDSQLPQCYSRPSADPSEGSWRKCENGVDDSPTDMVNWEHSEKDFARAPDCSKKWAEHHSGEGPMPFSVWEADNCFLDTVDADKFCRVMEGRKGLLFVGDSLTRQMTTTLATILRAEGIVTGFDDQCLDEWLACNGTLKMHYRRNDFLDTRTERLFENNTRGFDQKHCEQPDLSKTRCTILADDDTLSGFDTLVVNSGAHPRPGETYGPAMKVASQAIAASMKRLHGDDEVILIVRNTVPGHTDCTNRMFDGPVDLDVALALVDAAPENYKYTTFDGNNRLLEKAFLTDPSDGWRLIDAYTPTVLRPDLHLGGKDCLHYCVPGPTDHWVRLLYNMLLAATESDSRGEA